MSRTVSLCALLLLAVLAAVPSAAAVYTPQDPLADHAEVCLLGPRTLEWYGEVTYEQVVLWTLAPCTENGATVPAMDRYAPAVPSGGLVFASGGDHTDVGVQHGYLLGGSLIVSLYEDHAQLMWSHGITHCWIDLPSSAAPQCVY